MLSLFLSLWLTGAPAFALTPDGQARLEQVRSVLATTDMSQPPTVQVSRFKLARQQLSAVLAEDPTNAEALRLRAAIDARAEALEPHLHVVEGQEAARRANDDLERAAAMMTDAATHAGMIRRLLDDARVQLEVMRDIPQYKGLVDQLERRIEAIERDALQAEIAAPEALTDAS